jgi:hypothetical protein
LSDALVAVLTKSRDVVVLHQDGDFEFVFRMTG